MNSNLTEFLNRHKWRILLVLIGLLVLILCFTIGFWRTIFNSCRCYGFAIYGTLA